MKGEEKLREEILREETRRTDKSKKGTNAVKVDRERVEGFKTLLRRERNLKKKLYDFSEDPLRAVDVVTGSSPQFPYIKQRITVEGIDYSAFNKLKKQYVDAYNRVLNDLNDIIEYIEALSDPVERMILQLYCIEGKTWLQVGMELGYDPSWAAKKYKKIFQREDAKFSKLNVV